MSPAIMVRRMGSDVEIWESHGVDRDYARGQTLTGSSAPWYGNLRTEPRVGVVQTAECSASNGGGMVSYACTVDLY